MSAPKIVHGARCKIGFIDANGQTQYVGIYNHVSYGVNLDVIPAFILGRYTAAKIQITGVEPVGITCSGYRVIDHGPYVAGHIPTLKDLLNFDSIVMSIYDRETDKEIARFSDVVPASFNTSISPKQLEEMSMTYMGIIHDDEFTLAAGGNAEDSTAMNLGDQ